MKVRKDFFNLTVGGLAFTVAVYAAPRDRAAEEMGQARSESSRLLTGDRASLREAVDGGVATGGNPYAVLRPVPAGGTQTYPAGTVVDTANRTITIPAGPTKVFIDSFFDGWGDGTSNPAQTYKTGQITIDSATFSNGLGAPIQNAAPQACANRADCISAYGPASSGTYCHGGVCEDAFQNTNRADYCLAGQPAISSCSLATPDRTCGNTTLGKTLPDGPGECYNCTFVLSVPAGAAGTYTIGMIPVGTLIQLDDNTSPPLAKLSPALIIVQTIPNGSCCIDETCSVTDQAFCDAEGGSWTGATDCTPNPCSGPAGSCCINETCSVTNQAICNVEGGTWTEGEDCTPHPCGPIGSCCIEETCSQTNRVFCNEQGGRWTGGADCTPNPCAIPTGRCCIDETCSVTTHAGCVANGGAWYFGGQCTANTCRCLTVASSTPADCAIDARRPHSLTAFTPLLGFDRVALQFSEGADENALGAGDFRISHTPSGGALPTITSVNPLGPGKVELVFDKAFVRARWTCISFNLPLCDPNTSKVCTSVLPLDVDNDGTADLGDLSELLAHMNGSLELEDWQTDMNRSRTTTTADIIDWIDIHNGAGLYTPTYINQTIIGDTPCP